MLLNLEFKHLLIFYLVLNKPPLILVIVIYSSFVKVIKISPTQNVLLENFHCSSRRDDNGDNIMNALDCGGLICLFVTFISLNIWNIIPVNFSTLIYMCS